MLPDFQQYLVDNGFRRYTIDFIRKNTQKADNYKDTNLSTYGPLCYYFEKDGNIVSWGLREYGRPPVMFLGEDKIRVIYTPKELTWDKAIVSYVIQSAENGDLKFYTYITKEDGYRALFARWKHDKYGEILDVIMSTDKRFVVDYTSETDVSIYIEKRAFPKEGSQSPKSQ